jgi:diaminohydroxyphosphoribosylaminopyrimidine deaminase/5-amino-6-(5-phosphoribosylamino)uracil reductase
MTPDEAMARALQLAARGKTSTHPNPRVGCVIIRKGEVVGEGWHVRAGEPHAEIHALRVAGERARGATVYLTLEPCAHHGRTPPCVDALIAAGVGRVVAAMQDPNPLVGGKGIARLREAGIPVELGLREAEARALNRGFVARIARRRPWLTLKLAASLDGRTAMASGESRWITGAAARVDAHRLRAEAGAVLAGADTVLADDPQLNVRDWSPEEGIALRAPDRIVIDSRARVPANANVWSDDGARRFWLVGDGAKSAPPPAGVRQLPIAKTADGHLDLSAALRALAEQDVNEVLVEAGPRLAGALLTADVVDELLLYVAPALLGHAARPLAMLPGLDRLADRLRFTFGDVQPLGEDLRVCLRPVHA